MKAVVTGGAGFIGSHLVDRLLDEGYSVTVVDNMSCGCMDNLRQHSGNSRLAVEEVDIREADELKRVFAGHDVVFHLAAHANIRSSLADHRADLDNNLIGTLNILEAMEKNKIQDLVFASTSALYGEAAVRPTPEDYLGAQTSLYGASKLACVTAKAKVLTEQGLKKISEIRVGDRVYTHKNNLKRVVRTFKRLHDGELTKIRIGNAGGHGFKRFVSRPHPELPINCQISATPEHPVLTEGGWKPIGQIKVGDRVAVVANRCVACKKLIPYWTVTCSSKCMFDVFPDIRVKIGNAGRGHRNYLQDMFGDPVRKAEWLRKVLENKTMNSHEFYVSLLIKEAGGDSFRFTGNGRRIIGGFCPDFVSESLKAIIEYQGRSGARDARLNRDQERRLAAFREGGYSVLLLNTKEDFEHPEQAIQKIKSFIAESISIAVRTDPEYIFVPVYWVKTTKRANSRRPINVYNLEVEDDNSYICQGIVMHNCEAFVEAYTEFAPVRFWAFRFANIVGERCSRGVVGDFVRKLLKNPCELEILGDGKQSKEYLYVKDCVEGILLGYRKSSGKVNIFNLGMEEQTLVDRVADIVVEEMKLSKVKRRYTGGQGGWIGDNPVVELSLERILKLGWRPKVSSEEAIRRTARWNLEHETRRSSSDTLDRFKTVVTGRAGFAYKMRLKDRYWGESSWLS